MHDDEGEAFGWLGCRYDRSEFSEVRPLEVTDALHIRRRGCKDVEAKHVVGARLCEAIRSDTRPALLQAEHVPPAGPGIDGERLPDDQLCPNPFH